jgi:hypothetical protein
MNGEGWNQFGPTKILTSVDELAELRRAHPKFSIVSWEFLWAIGSMDNQDSFWLSVVLN